MIELTFDAALEIMRTGNEEALRDLKAPWPKSADQLTACVAALVERQHDYGTCVYAMSLAAEAAYNHVASKLGVTGFQAGCADTDFLRRTRRMEHGFAILDADGVLYPQHWDARRAHYFGECLSEPESRLRFAKEAERRRKTSPIAAARVAEHWDWIASLPNNPSAEQEIAQRVAQAVSA